MHCKLLVLSVLQLTVFCHGSFRFTGYETAPEVKELMTGVSLISMEVDTPKQALAVEAAVAFNDFLGEFSEIRPGSVELLCKTENLDFIKKMGLKWQMVINDMSEMLTERAKKNSDDEDWFEAYHTLDYIHAKLDEMVALYPNIATKISLGTSWEGRQIEAIRISGPNPTKAIVYHGGIHAREWIGPAVVQFVYHELLRGYAVNPVVTRLVNEIEWTIIPVLNVDGYVYAHEVNPAWRKTRKPNAANPECIGTDPNRNWAFMWGVGGSQTDPCSGSYMGFTPFDNPEPRSVDLYVKDRQAAGLDVLGYIDFHCCGLLWMSPYAYIRPTDHVPDNDAELKALGSQISSAILGVHGMNFRVGNIADPQIIGLASGSSVDHVLHLGVPYSYGVELRGDSQFDPSVIIPSGEEMWAGVLVMGNRIVEM